MRDRFQLALLLACFFLSGLAALIYQTAWTREFAFVFGTSELAVATVLAAYMAGLAVGAAAGARLATRVERPVLVYGLLELGVGLSALGVPLAIGASTSLYVALFSGAGMTESSGSAFTAFYLVCSLVILVVPTAFMGATLPLLIRHAVRRPEEIGRRVSLLYGVNTVGAVVGTVLAGFLLLPALGLRETIWVAVALNGVVFLAAAMLARGASPRPVEASPSIVHPDVGRRVWILPFMLASGVCSFSYEVLWTRLLSHVLGGSVYAFATMLATFLTGIAVGSLVAGRWASSPARSAVAFGWVQIGTALLSLAAWFQLGWLPGLVRQLHAGSGAGSGADAVIAGCLLLPSTLCIGATFPLAVRVLAERESDAGPASARVYAWNTVGAIVGALGAGFFVIPALGYARSITAVVAVNGLLAAGSVLLVDRTSRRVWWPAGALGLALLFVRLQPPWAILLSSLAGMHVPAGDVTRYDVGRSATVLTLEQPHGWELRTNGLIEAEILRHGERAAVDKASHWLGVLPVLARPEARSLFSIGLGGGVALEDLPGTLDRIDVVELEPRVVDANRTVAPGRRSDPLSDPRLTLAVNDARAALLLTDERYDAIISQPSHPWVAGAAHLYTQDFFELARSRLAPDGVFVQWMGTQFVDVELLETLVATLQSVFPYVRVYSPMPPWVVLFVASESPLDLEATAPRALAASPEVFASIGLVTPDDVRAGLLLDEATARRFSDGAPINTDDHNLLQVRSPLLLPHYLENQRDWLETLARFDPLVRDPAVEDLGYLVRRLAREQQLDRALRIAAVQPDPARAASLGLVARAAAGQLPVDAARRALAAHPHDEQLRALALEQRDGAMGELQPPLSPTESLLVAARALEDREDWSALEDEDAALAALDPRAPLYGEALRLRATWRVYEGDARSAREGLALLEPTLAVWPLTADLLLNARLAAVAGDTDVLLASIRELAGRPDATADEIATARSLLGALDVPAADRPRQVRLLALLEAAMAAPR